MKFWINETQDQSEAFIREYEKKASLKRKDGIPFIFETRNNGKIMIFNLFVYCLLLNEAVRGFDIENDTEAELNGLTAFLPIFLEGYKEGQKQFKERYSFSPDIYFGTNAAKIVRMFHELLFHEKLSRPFRKGWSYVARNSPLLLTEGELRFYGFYSAMLAGLEEIDAKYPKALKGIDICEREKENHRIEPKPAFKIIDIKLFQPVQDLFLKAGVSEQHLFDAIEGKPIEGRIVWSQNQNQLADLFRRLLKNSVIHGSFSEIAKWLNTYFEADVKGKRQPVNQTTCYDVLREHKDKIPHRNRLLFKVYPEINE
jgi:hypothetical protein